jgi:hypothetical protein
VKLEALSIDFEYVYSALKDIPRWKRRVIRT